MAAKTQKLKKRWFVLGAIAVPILWTAGYAQLLLNRNAKVERQWDRWTAHLAWPPSSSSWHQPSNELHRFASDTVSVKAKHGWTTMAMGYIDASGDVVIEPRFVSCGRRFYDGLAWANEGKEAGGRSGYINPDGTWAFTVPGSTHRDFMGGMGEFQIIGEDRWPIYGYVNRTGTVAVPPIYSSVSVHGFVDGYAKVSRFTRYGQFLKRYGGAGDVTIISDFGLGREYFFIDMNGNEVSLPER